MTIEIKHSATRKSRSSIIRIRHAVRNVTAEESGSRAGKRVQNLLINSEVQYCDAETPRVSSICAVLYVRTK